MDKREPEMALTTEFSSDARHVTRVVATEGNIGDWAAYVENDYTRDLGNELVTIRSHGDKIGPNAAARIFPDWAQSLKWRR